MPIYINEKTVGIDDERATFFFIGIAGVTLPVLTHNLVQDTWMATP